jgi:Flp pilus assembly protein TadG
MSKAMPPRRLSKRAILRDVRGATILEFALVLPVLCIMLFGALDFAYTLYIQAVLQGSMQKAARDSTLEGSTAATIDANVQDQVTNLNKSGTVTFTRRYYRSFSDASAAQAEPFVDTNHNGTCDGPVGATPGESYTDTNNNGIWDKDGGNSGQGGARDVTVYTATMSYPRLFPIYNFMGGSNTMTISATTVLTNQPFGDQGTYPTPVARQCT